MNKNTLTALALILPLAACGGSSSGGDVVQDVVEALTNGNIDPSIIPTLADAGAGDLTVEQIEEAAEEFGEEFGDLIQDEEYTDLSSLPTEGNATFNGVFGIAESQILTDEDGSFIEGIGLDDVVLAGEMSLTLELDGDSLSGDVVNLRYTDDEEVVSGTLDVMAELDRDADLSTFFGVEGTVTGDLTDSEGDFSLDLELVGDLFGSNAEALAGDVFGDIVVDGDNVGVAAGLFGLVNQGAVN